MGEIVGETKDDIWTSVRTATPDDYQELFRIVCLAHAENGQHEFNEDKIKHLVWRGCNRDNAIIGAIGKPDDLRAMIYLQLAPVYYSLEWQLTELLSYVRDDSRRCGYAKKLLNFAKKCTDETGLDLFIGIVSDHRLEAKSRLYERQLPKGGTFYIYKAKKAEGELSNG